MPSHSLIRCHRIHIMEGGDIHWRAKPAKKCAGKIVNHGGRWDPLPNDKADVAVKWDWGVRNHHAWNIGEQRVCRGNRTYSFQMNELPPLVHLPEWKLEKVTSGIIYGRSRVGVGTCRVPCWCFGEGVGTCNLPCWCLGEGVGTCQPPCWSQLARAMFYTRTLEAECVFSVSNNIFAFHISQQCRWQFGFPTFHDQQHGNIVAWGNLRIWHRSMLASVANEFWFVNFGASHIPPHWICFPIVALRTDRSIIFA